METIRNMHNILKKKRKKVQPSISAVEFDFDHELISR